MRRLFIAVTWALLIVFITGPAHADQADFSTFAGKWEHHGAILTIDSTGYIGIDDPNHNISIPLAQIDYVNGDTAYAHSRQDGTPMLFTRLPYGMIAIITPDPSAWKIELWCDPSPNGAPLPAELQITIPCGI